MTRSIFYLASKSAYILRDVRVDEGQNKGGGQTTEGNNWRTAKYHHSLSFRTDIQW